MDTQNQITGKAESQNLCFTMKIPRVPSPKNSNCFSLLQMQETLKPSTVADYFSLPRGGEEGLIDAERYQNDQAQVGLESLPMV